ncbi:MAG: PorP/SprF family type IX secretion system membrane protein [Bacteroidota bacterium]|jgi:type IX secretion system PorP/SprF family membrane protein
MKKYISFIVLAAFVFTADAQDRSSYYTNLFNPFLANPAMAGSYDNLHTILNARTMVGGIESAPRTINFALHTPFANNTGLGFKIINHWNGAFRTINTEGAYSKNIRLTDDHKLTFGLSVGFMQTNLNEDLINSSVDRADPNLNLPDLNKMYFTAGAGLVYRYKTQFEIHASSPMMATGAQSLSSFFVLGTNYKFFLDEEKIYTLKPMVNYYNFTLSPKLVDLLITGAWNDVLNLTTGYRTNGTVVAGFGINFKNVVIGYNYYHHTSDMNRLAPAQNEIAIAFNFKKPEKRIRKKQEVVDEAIIQDQIEKINLRINGLINIEKSNPGLVNVKNELAKINRDLEKILSKYKIENIEQLKRIKELQTSLELLIAKYND